MSNSDGDIDEPRCRACHAGLDANAREAWVSTHESIFTFTRLALA